MASSLMSSFSLLYGWLVMALVIPRSKSVIFPSLFCRMMERLRSRTEMLRPSHGMEWYSRSFVNLNLTDILLKQVVDTEVFKGPSILLSIIFHQKILSFPLFPCPSLKSSIIRARIIEKTLYFSVFKRFYY